MKNPSKNLKCAIVGIFAALFAPFSLNAQYAGTHYVGTDQEFVTLQEAIDSLENQGITTPVTILLKTGNYNEQISIPPIPGATETNRITISSETQNPDDVRIYYSASNSNANYVLLFRGCDYVSVENIEFVNNTLSSGYTRVISFTQYSSGINAEFNAIRNCRIIGKSGSPTTADEALIGHYRKIIGGTEIIGNQFLGGSYSLYFDIYNFETEVSENLKIKGNTFSSNRGVYLEGLNKLEFIGNTLSSNSDHGLNLYRCHENIRIAGNRISSYSTSAHKGIYINDCDGSIAFRGLISNNVLFINDNGENNDENYGIHLNASSYQDIYHNTIYLKNTNTLGFACRIQDSENNKVKNNQFSVGAYGYAFGTNTALAECDNNNYFTPGNYIASWNGGNIYTLSSLQSASSANANSTDIYPSFQSITDIAGLIPQTHWLNNTGANLSAVVSHDIDSIARPTSPDVGAFEFEPFNEITYSGELTIKESGGTFTSFTEAFDSLSKLGISGAVTLLADPKTYNERFSIPQIPGSGASNTITITSATQNPADVVVQYSSTSESDNSVVRFLGSDFVTLENVTVRNTGANYGVVLRLVGHASNVTIQNCVLEGSGGQNTSTDRTVLISNFQKPQNLTINNNVIIGGSRGIYLCGVSVTDRANLVTISENQINGGYTGIYLGQYSDFEVSGNQINAFTWGGIALNECYSPYQIRNNKLSSTVVTDRGISLYKSTGTGNGGRVYNNFVHIEGSSGILGIYLYDNTYSNIYNNSVNVVSTSTSARALYSQHYTTTSNIEIKNNNLVVNGPGHPYYVNNVVGISASDNNNLFTSGTNVAFWGGTNYSTIAGLSAASGKDLNSVNFDPGYVSASDLHTNSYWLDNKGTPIPGIVSDDIDGDPRHPTTPDIGADEYTSTLVPYAGYMTIGTTGRFATFSQAIDSLNERGILDSVIFRVQPGYYAEQLTIPQIAGISETKYIVFESETGNASDATLIFDPTMGNNFVVKFVGADYVRFRNLSFNVGNTSYARIFVFEGKCEHIKIQHNILNGRSESSTSDADAVLYAYDNNPIINYLEISGNTINNGSFGMFLVNNTSTYGEMPMILNNTISTYLQGFYIRYFLGPQITGNTISISNNDGIGMNIQNINSGATYGSEIVANRIYAAGYLNSSTSGGIYLNQYNGNVSFRALVANNELRVGINNASYRSFGLNMVSSGYIDFYYNTINVIGQSKDDIAFYSSNSNFLNINNNNFVIKGNLTDKTLSLGVPYYVANSNILSSDFNNYYSAGNYLAYWSGTWCQTLTDLRSANAKDANSVNYFPAFINANDLQTNSPWLDNKGTHISLITTDINGNQRNESLPDIGAYEYSSTLEPLASGSYTFGFGGVFATADELAEALMEKGIAGSVSVEFLPGAHQNFSLSLKDIPGATSSDTVVFKSQSGTSSNTVLAFAQTANQNYMVRFNGTDFVTIRNLTFNTAGTSHSCIVRLDGNSKNVTLESNVFNGVSSTSDEWANKSTLFVPSDQVVDYLTVRNNQFTNNSAGVYYSGFATYNHNSLRVEHNTFQGQYRQIYFQYTKKPYISGNVLNDGKKYGIYLYYCPNDAMILGNKVLSPTTGFYGIYFYYSDGSAANRGLVANNFVGVTSSNSYPSYGIKYDYSDYQRAFYNTARISGSGSGYAMHVFQGENIQLANNIYYSVGTDTYTYGTQNTTAVTVSNYNDFFATGSRNIQYAGTGYTTLAAYQAVSFMDNNSVSINPELTSGTDFHLTSSALIGLALPLADVSTDIDGEPRDLSTPDMGADEFSCIFYLPPVVTSASGCSNEEVPALHAEGTNIKWYSDPGLTNELWAANEFTPEISEPGVYTFYVTQSSELCTSPAAVATLTIFEAPQLSASVTHIDCQGTEFGSINLTIEGEGPFNYFWSNGQITEDILGLTTGEYSVTVSGVNGCSESAVFSVESPSEIVLEIITQDTECNTSLGTASVVATGGQPDYIYSWTNGETGTVIDSLASGIYYVTVTDALGCSSYGIATVNDIGGPTISLESVIDVSCYGGSNGAISVAVSGGEAPYEYNWSNGSNTEDINNIPAGQYQLVVNDTEGCKAIENMTVNQPFPLNVIINTAQATCGSADGVAQAAVTGGTSPYNYEWSNGATTAQISGLGMGSYSVTVSDANNCTAIRYFTISEIGSPTVIIDQVVQATCGNADGAIYITAYGSSTEFSYLWSNGAETEDLIGVEPGMYSVVVSDTMGCDAVQVATIPADIPAGNPICMVSVDSATNHAEVIWEKLSTANVLQYNVYREGSQAGVYSLIGSVPVSDYGEFVDTISDVTTRSWRYKLSVVDSCGIESPLSNYHKTMHVTVNIGINHKVNLIWNHYEGFEYETYYIYRRSNAGWEKLDSIPSNLNSYTDQNPIFDEMLYYMIEIEHPTGCDPEKAGSRNTSRSNVTNGSSVANPNGILSMESQIRNFVLFPNPNSGQFDIRVEVARQEVYSYVIYNVSNQIVEKKPLGILSGLAQRSIDLSHIPNGVYFFVLSSNSGMKVQKLVINR